MRHLICAIGFSLMFGGYASANADDALLERRLNLIEAMPQDITKQNIIDCIDSAHLAEQSALAANHPSAAEGAARLKDLWLDVLAFRFDYEPRVEEVLAQSSLNELREQPGFSFLTMRDEQKKIIKMCLANVDEAVKSVDEKASK